VNVPSWPDLEAVFLEVLARAPVERAAFVAERCAGRPDLQAEVEGLLRAHEEAGGWEVTLGAAVRLKPGLRVGPYEVVSELGAGGMGEVYRARDTKLGREVALKILPASFARDTDRVRRFEREARVLAALNHPNIATIHGLEEADNVLALVMELVEGETLAERIAQGTRHQLQSPSHKGLPIDQALAIATQIAAALDAAHEKGIVHRDLKPANIKITPAGTVKVLDFGLAKVASGDGAEAQAPTLTMGGTHEGVILGTAAYMSPEQASGNPVDRRSDLWSFGVVLLEMLTGRRVFDGETVSHVLAAVLTKDPDWTALPAKTPASIRTLLRRCLEKDRKRRMPDAAAARLEIEDALGGTGATEAAVGHPRLDEAVATARAPVRRVMRVRVVLASATALVVGLALAGGGVWLATRPAPPQVVQTTIATTPATALTITAVDRDVAITPDGARLVYLGNGGRTLFVRALDTLEPMALYTGVPRAPFISPDGEWVGFMETGILKKVAITGGPAVTIAPAQGSGLRAAVWLPDDTVVFATNAAVTGLQQVAAGGGTVTVLTRPDRAKGEAYHLWPEPLPGGRAVLFTIVPTTGGTDATQIAVLDLATRTQAVVLRGGSHAQYVASPSASSGQAGYLVYAAGGTLRAVAFDLATRTTQGTPVPVVPEVVVTGGVLGAGIYAVVAADGTLAYVRGAGGAGAPRTLAWVDRQGRETAIAAPPRAYLYPRLSPDGSRLAVFAADQDNDLWLWDLARLTLTRLTFTPALDGHPVWASDGRRLFFSSERAGARNLYAQAADGTGTAERLTTSPNLQVATGVTPDGTRLLFFEISPQTSFDVLQVEVTGSHAVTPLVQTPAQERNGVVSPDGRWLAYEANDSGRLDIYVRPYPDAASGRWQVSTGGGVWPLWARDGRELFYATGAGALMRVGVERGASWTATAPAMLLKDGSVMTAGAFFGRNYDVAPDGQRFVVPKEASGPDAAPPQLVVVQHFDELLKRLVPAN
jgi:eukaryotic-like serine/threonine-protein kinase